MAVFAAALCEKAALPVPASALAVPPGFAVAEVQCVTLALREGETLLLSVAAAEFDRGGVPVVETEGEGEMVPLAVLLALAAAPLLLAEALPPPGGVALGVPLERTAEALNAALLLTLLRALKVAPSAS